MTPAQLQALSGAIAVATVIMSVFALALGIRVGQATWLLRRPGLLLRSVVTSVALVPLVSTLLVFALGTTEAVALALILLGVSPAAPMMQKKAASAGGDADYAPSLQIVLAALSIVTVPLSLRVISAVFPMHQASISPWAVAGQVGRAQLVPLAAGIAIRAAWPGMAERLARPLGRIAGLLLVAVAVLVLLLQRRLFLFVGPGGYLVVALAVGVSALLGHLLGGPRRSTRTGLAIACAVRNPGLALMIIQVNFPGRGAGAVVLVYVVASVILLALLGRVLRAAGRID